MLKKPKQSPSEFQQYKNDVLMRLANLEEEETNQIKNLYGSPALITIGKIIGPEVSEALATGINSIADPRKAIQPQAVKKRGLAAR